MTEENSPDIMKDPQFWAGVLAAVIGVSAGVFLIVRAVLSLPKDEGVGTVKLSSTGVEIRGLLGGREDAVREDDSEPERADGGDTGAGDRLPRVRTVTEVGERPVSDRGQPRERVYRPARFGSQNGAD